MKICWDNIENQINGKEHLYEKKYTEHLQSNRGMIKCL